MKYKNPRVRYISSYEDDGSQQYFEDLYKHEEYLKENPQKSVDYTPKSTSRGAFEDYSDAPTLDSEKGTLAKIGESISSFASGIWSDSSNSNRMWMKKLIDQFIDNDYANLYDAHQEKEDLRMIKEYKELHVQLNNLLSKPQFDERGFKISEQQYLSKVQDLQNKIKQYDDYFMGEGRSHTIIAQEMFDVNKMNIVDKGFVNSAYALRNLKNSPNHYDGSIGGFFQGMGDDLQNIVSAATGAVDWAVTAGAQQLDKLFGYDDRSKGYMTGEVIKSLDSNNPDHKMFLDKLYKGSVFNKKDINYSIDDASLANKQQLADKTINEYTTELKIDQQFAKDGKLFGIDIYDREDIPDQFKEAQENFGKNWYDYVIHPYDAILYSMPETATTIGLYKHQAGAIGVNALLGFLSKRAPTWAISASSNVLKYTGSALSHGFSQSAMEATAMGSGIAAARASRVEETGLEAIQAVSQRVMEDVQKKGGDMESILTSVQSTADRMGIDTSDFTLEDAIKFAIAYNIDTPDQTFNESKRNARKGLNKLINANNALAVVDYLQSLPFMSYSGSVMKKWASNAMKTTSGKYGAYMPKLVEAEYVPVMQSINDLTVGRLAKKFINDKAVKQGLYTKHLGGYLLNKTPLILSQSISEGYEEMNQEILQDRYRRGLYDNYNKPYSMLDPNEIFDNVDLAFEATAAYWGMTPWDPDLNVENIRRAFHIGAATSALFSGALHASSNLYSNDSDNMRSLLSQLKSDKHVSNIVANYYNQVQDQTHLGLFYDAFTKAGINRSKLAKSLLDLKEGVDEQNTLVNKDYVDSDIQLMNAAWEMYTNEDLNEALKANKIKKGSDEHKQIVIDGAAAIVAVSKNLEKIHDQSGDIQNRKRNHTNLVSELLDELTPKERLKQIQDEYPELYNTVQGLRKDYIDYRNTSNQKKLAKYGAYVKKLTSSIDNFANNEGVQNYIRTNGIDESSTVDDGTEEFNPLMKEANRIFADEKERRKALKHAYEFEKRKHYGEILQDKQKFFRNSYIRQYARDQVAFENELDRKLEEIYNDEKLRYEAINHAYKIYDDGTYSERNYVTERIHLLHFHNEYQRLKHALQIAKDQRQRLIELRKSSGLDTESSLEGIIGVLESQVKKYEQEQDKQFGNKNKPDGEKITWFELFKDKDYKFDDQQEFDQIFSTLQLNQAILQPQRILAQAYLQGKYNPIELSEAIYGETTDSNILSDIVRQYRDITAIDQAELDPDTKISNVTNREARNRDKQQLSKQAAWAIIKDRLDKKMQRRRIANRIYEEEAPITPGYMEDKLNEAENKIQEEVKEQPKREEPQSLNEAEYSEAEKKLSQLYNGEDPETIQDKIDKINGRVDEDSHFDINDQDEEDDPMIADVIKHRNEDSTDPGISTEDEPVLETRLDEDDVPVVINQQDDENDANDEIVPGIKDREQFVDDADITDQTIVEGSEKIKDDEESILPKNDDNWVNIEDYSQLEYTDDGTLLYKGTPLPDDQTQIVEDDLILLGLTETIGISQNNLPEDVDNSEESKKSKSNESLANLVSSTFFYQPNPNKNEETGEYELPKLVVDSKQVVLNKPLASGKQLSEKLSEPGWLRKTKKYYIVTQSQQGKNIDSDMDARDSMTVAMIIEDEHNSYAVFLRALGTTYSELDSEGRTITINAEENLRNWLASRNVDWNKVLQSSDDFSDKYAYDGDTIIYKKTGTPLSSSQKVKLYKEAVELYAKDLAKGNYYAANNGSTEGFESFWSKDPNRSNYTTDEAYEKAKAERVRLRKLSRDRARMRLSYPGKYALSDEQIDQEIKSLRSYRNQIIDQYLTTQDKGGKIEYIFPNEVRTDVTPMSVVQSNGRIVTKKDQFQNPVYRTIGSDDMSIDEIQSSLESGDMLLGYGLGMFANEDEKWAIRGVLDSDATEKYNGRGLSGKIYWMVKGPAGSQHRIPIMLAEEKFNTQIKVVGGKHRTVWLNDTKDMKNLRLCLSKNADTKLYENTDVEGYLPSAAEVLFYMLIGEINVGLNPEMHAELVEFFIHSGEKTLLKNQPKSKNDPFNVLARKQLSYNSEEQGDRRSQVLSIGLLEDGKYVLKQFTREKLLEQTEEAENIRKRIVYAIATQMHWNTDLAHMNSSINISGTSNSSVSALFDWAMRQAINNNEIQEYEDNTKYLNQRVSLFGCPQLSFRIGDFYTERDGKVVKKDNVSILAWMIKEQKLKTDTEDKIFADPFVFASGVKTKGGSAASNLDKIAEEATGDPKATVIEPLNPVEKDDTKSDKKKKKSKSSKKENKPESQTAFELYDDSKYQDMTSTWKKGQEQMRIRKGWRIAKTQEEREEILQSLNATAAAKQNEGIVDRIFIRPSSKSMSQNAAESEFKKIIQDFLNKYNQKFGKEYKIENIDINTLALNSIKEQWGKQKGYVLLDLYGNGTGKVQFKKNEDFNTQSTGIYSKTIGGEGTFEFERAKAWLVKTLGIDENNILLTKAVMRSTTDESVFGLTNVALDRIIGEIFGYFKFSEKANAGIEYHEAWHYVNLLLHDENTRRRIYESYIKTHKGLNEDLTIGEVEEMMADEFKKFMEGYLDNSLSGKVKRLYNNVLDFLIISRRKKAYKRVFRDIAKGKYASVKLNPQSALEFQRAYNKYGVASTLHSVPGFTKEELEQMQGVEKYQDIFEGADAIVSRIFSTMDVSSTKKMNRIVGEGFQEILDMIDDMIGEQSDDSNVLKLQSIRQNEPYIRKLIVEAFAELGVTAKVKKITDVKPVELNKSNEDSHEKEENPENTYDKFTLSYKRKENASLMTKMFLRQIPMYSKHYVYDEDTEQYSPEYVPERDSYGTHKTYDPDEAWRTMLDALWSCTSFSDMEEDHYSPYSIMGLVESKKNADPFFYSLFEKLQEIEYDPNGMQLKSQILSTLNSSKNQVQLIFIQDKRKSNSVGFDEAFMFDTETDMFSTASENGSVADLSREWILRNDNLISVARNIPRQWSKSLASNGLLSFNRTTNESVVDTKFAKSIDKELSAIKGEIQNYATSKKKGFTPKSEQQLSKFLHEIKPRVVNFYQQLGIDCDRLSLNVFIAMISGIKGELTLQQQVDALNTIFNTSGAGTITKIVGGIVSNVGKNEVTPQGSKYQRAIDEVFNGYSETTHVGILALAWNAVHPSSQEYSVKDANNNRLYPINMNNHISDKVRELNKKNSKNIEGMRKSKYCKHSVIFDCSEQVDKLDPKTAIKLNTFVGIRDANKSIGADYFAITAQEDYLSKLFMTESDQLIFPTMADKKTWNTLSSSKLKLSHDVMIISPLAKDMKTRIQNVYSEEHPYDDKKYTSKYKWENEAEKWFESLDEFNKQRQRIIELAVDDLAQKRTSSVGFDISQDRLHVHARFSDTTLSRFAGYFLDELDSLIDYYSENHVKHVVNNPNARIENFHGKVKDGRLDFSGNGGKFRYMYDIQIEGHSKNLNHHLQALFELQKKIEAGNVLDRSKQEGDVAPYIAMYEALGKKENYDGFELIREYLKQLRKDCVGKGDINKTALLDGINNKLVNMTLSELERLSLPGPLQLVEYSEKYNAYISKSIPEQMLTKYTEALQDAGYGKYGKPYDAEELLPHATFSLIGNHVVNTITSIIEVEKVFSGDPAAYKKKTYGKNDERSTSEVTIRHEFKDGSIAEETVTVENLDDVSSDKIKRLGGTLSPGNELRLDYTEDELKFDPTLKSSKYTVLNVEDVEVQSLFLKEIESEFRKQILVDMIRSSKIESFDEFLKKFNEKRLKNADQNKQIKPVNLEQFIDLIYSNDDVFWSLYNRLSKSEKEYLKSNLSKQTDPYTNINVADAQVFIRPALYRKIRIALGEWSFEPDENGYSDEEAYNIIEGITVNEDGRTHNPNPNGDWMQNPELYSKVRKLQLYPLKMSYFQNEEVEICKDVHINKGIYNKMAIFPLFAYQRSTSVGKEIYERMNREGNELDMIAFKSAVKVGAIQKGVELFDSSGTPEEALTKLKDQLNNPSDRRIDYTRNEVISNSAVDSIGVSVQDLKNLRLQLNTKAHEDAIRAIGTQMFKIAFSNIIDDAEYGTNKKGRPSRKGYYIKRDIMACINALTRLGEQEIKERFYINGKLNNRAVKSFMDTVTKNNGLGFAAENLIQNGATASSVTSRTVYENSASAVVNSAVVNINTKGGTAIQQSVVGFVGYGNENVATLSYNDGRELKWLADEGSMQVILSMNFFKSVVPKAYQTDFNTMRDWLIKNNIIGEKSKPFGIGYRIPTQGMSSMFAFQVADVIPEQSGDLIIVPREFTAQTGSDFDVDKIYLATFSYKGGVLEEIDDAAFKNGGKRTFEQAMDIAESRILKSSNIDEDEINVQQWLDDARDIMDEDVSGAISNRLLWDYIDIITDRRNYGDARGSIDDITSRLKKTLLPILRPRTEGYTEGMLELLPSFQALRKMEFSVGKSGIGPFALNITNLALTQYTHLTMNFGELGEEFGLHSLDQILGEDGIRISAWLSAMVNAHVDVAKDPYVFALNVNQATYNHVNLLLRAGKGMSTFTFVAQPILKDYANEINNNGGIYGANLDGSTPVSEQQKVRRKDLYLRKLKQYSDVLNNIVDEYEESIDEGLLIYAKSTVEYYQFMFLPNKDKKDKKPPVRPIKRQQIFNQELGKLSIQQYESIRTLNSENADEVIESLMFQLACMESFYELNTFAENLSQLVQCSQIDTKKFGRTIPEQIHFVNKYDDFRLNSDLFTINKPGFEESVQPRPGAVSNKPTSHDISREALRQYFNNTYLDLKLRKAVQYTKDVLSHQLFTATDQYESLFKNLLAIINGESSRIDYDQVTLLFGYNPSFNSESLKSFANGLENIIRFNTFMSVGYSIYKKEIKNNSESNMIDFTMGGDMSAVIDKVNTLVYGSDEQKSIFTRLGNFIKTIQKDPYSDVADGLVDDEGNIQNDLLLYLKPQTPNDKYPIGRMLLSSSQTDNKSKDELRLITAFYQLLEHQDQKVRELAKDLAIYAYFSQYDQNTAYSFFHLVPPEYRKQYDLALSNTLNNLNSNKNEVRRSAIIAISGLGDENSSVKESAAAINILDILSRNYWYDDNIVPVHYINTTNDPKKFQSTYTSNDRGEFCGIQILNPNTSKKYPTFVASTKVKNNAIWFKIKKGSDSMLYRRVGAVYRTRMYNEKEIKGPTYYIYAAVPKAGLRMESINQLELYANYDTESIFEQNKLYSDYAVDNIMKDIEEAVKDGQEYQANNENAYNLTLVWDFEQIPEMYKSSNNNVYIKSYTMEETDSKLDLTDVILKMYNSVSLRGQKHANVILDVVNTATTGEVERPNIKKDYLNKVVELPIDTDDVLSIVDNIKKLYTEGTEININLSTPLFDSKFEISDSDLDAYIKNKLELYKNTFSGSMKEFDTILQIQEEQMRNNKNIKYEILQDKLKKLMEEIISNLVAQGVSISLITSSAQEGKTALSTVLPYLQHKYGDYISKKNKIFVDEKFSKDKPKRFKGYLSSLVVEKSQNDDIHQEDETIVISADAIQNNEDEIARIKNKHADVTEEQTGPTSNLSDGSIDTESQDEETPTILKEAQEKENDKENSKNKECGGATNRRRMGMADAIDFT